MFCKNRITLIGFLGKDAETRFTANGTAHIRSSLATNVSWKDKASGEYKARTEWHQIVASGKFGEWAGSLKKGAYIEAEENFGTASSRRRFPRKGPRRRDPRHLDPDARSRRENGTRRRECGCGISWR
jgi:single stranded DNA-binding protein